MQRCQCRELIQALSDLRARQLALFKVCECAAVGKNTELSIKHNHDLLVITPERKLMIQSIENVVYWVMVASMLALSTYPKFQYVKYKSLSLYGWLNTLNSVTDADSWSQHAKHQKALFFPYKGKRDETVID